MPANRREFLTHSAALSFSLSLVATPGTTAPKPAGDNKKLGTIYNNDPDNILYGCLADGS